MPTVNFLLSIHDAKQAKDTVNHCQDHVLKTRTYLVRGRREALVVAVMIGDHSGTMGMGVME
jgi:ribosomal protein S5